MPTTIYQGAVAPEALAINVVPGQSGLDLSTVTAATLSVKDLAGTVSTWSATRSNQTASTLTLTHTLVAGDTAVLGLHIVYANLTVPGGTIRTIPKTFTVADPFTAS